jgi:hypothetical protein
MDLVADFFNDSSFIFIFILGAVGGLMGGILAGRNASAATSIILGSVFGVITSIIAAWLNAPDLVEVGGFPLLWAAGGGLVASYAISRSSD